MKNATAGTGAPVVTSEPTAQPTTLGDLLARLHAAAQSMSTGHPHRALCLEAAQWLVHFALSQEVRDLLAIETAAKGVVAQFTAIARHQQRLLVDGQTFETASAHWDEATLGHSIDFQPLMDALSARPTEPG